MDTRLWATPQELQDKFFQLRTAEDVAGLLEIDLKRLNYHLFISPLSTRYTMFNIPKKSGGVRSISAPATALKIIQQKLNYVLQHVYEPKPSVHSFTPKRSILTNAEPHSRKGFVFNIDLKDFFPSINFGRVRGMFMAYPYSLNESAATVLAQICCFGNELPQGAPTSPIVSNMICAKMDSELQRLARKHQCLYTRYADDITFSTYLPTFPAALARINDRGQLEVGTELHGAINRNGFEINSGKVRLQTRGNRQMVTGLTTNRFPNVQRKYVRQIRGMLHAWEKFGEDNAQREFLDRYDRKHRSASKQAPLFRQVVAGKIEFLGMVRGSGNSMYLNFRNRLKKLAPELVKGPKDALEPLLIEYDGLNELEDHQRRGHMLEDLLNRTFQTCRIPCIAPFKRNENGEQIDGAFKLEAFHFIVECRWRERLPDIQQVDGLYGKVARSGSGTMGLFLSILAWSYNVPGLLKQNPNKSVILMNGDDLRSVLSGHCELRSLISAKVDQLRWRSEPFYGANEFIQGQVDRKSTS